MATKKTKPATKKITKRAPRAKTATAKKLKPKAAPKAATTRRRATAAAATALSIQAVPRHAVYIDVENTNSEQGLFDVLDALGIDRSSRTTEVFAVGNWRAVGQQLGRRLGGLGAQLVHSAPARGVRDWSDLWIAVAAGCWLGQAKPGDILEIISNDRAFDAVADAAAGRGVVYHRLQHRRDVAAAAVAEPSDEPKKRSRRRGGRRRRRGGRTDGAPATTVTQTVPAAPRSTPPAAKAAPAAAARTAAARSAPAHAGAEPHGASRDQMIALINRLTNNQAGRWVNLDILENALKSEGFARPPGSPRLVTRLRALKDVEIDSHGRVRLATEVADA